MSAKPRPVTATFPPPPLVSPIRHMRPSSGSPSPCSSTASLLSILNHDSYASNPGRVARDDTFDFRSGHVTFDDTCESQSARDARDDFFESRSGQVAGYDYHKTGSSRTVLNHSYGSGSSEVTHNDSTDNKYSVRIPYSVGSGYQSEVNADGNSRPWTSSVATQRQESDARTFRRTVTRPNIKTERPHRPVSASSSKKNVRSKSLPNKKGPHESRPSENDSLESGARDSSPAAEKVDGRENRSSAELSPWERWIVQKAKEERRRTEEEMERLRKKKEEEERIQREKEEKRKKAEELIGNWMKEYDENRKKRTEVELRKSQQAEADKEKARQKVMEKAKAKYGEWMQHKMEEETKRRAEEAEKREREKAEKEERQKKNEAAFQEWCRKTRSRPRTAPSSFGYADGRLTGYYDSGAYPMPSYVNPIPWKPVEIPRPRTLMRKKSIKKNQRNNSARYYSKKCN